MFRFVKMYIPEPRVIVENFGGFVVKKLKFELSSGMVIEPMSEVNENCFEGFLIFVSFRNDIDSINESNAKTPENGKDPFFANIVENMRNDNRRIVRVRFRCFDRSIGSILLCRTFVSGQISIDRENLSFCRTRC